MAHAIASDISPVYIDIYEQGNFSSLDVQETSVEKRVDKESKKPFLFLGTRLQMIRPIWYSVMKDMGEDGLAFRCDWFVHKQYLFNNVENRSPKTIFLSSRSSESFPYFVDELLPLIKEPFVLIVACCDATFPNAAFDDRYPEMKTPENQERYRKLMKNPNLKACYVENLDQKGEKLYPLPVGVLGCDFPFEPKGKVDFSQRELKAMCIHRIHPGTSWYDRIKVNDLIKIRWSQEDLIYQKTKCGRKEFLKTLANYPFCLCVHGGGIDPSPKAWEALAMGCIPIIEHSTLDEAYSRFPVAFVDKWDRDAISKEKLEKWLEEFRPYYEDPEKRAKVVEMLGLDYWWKEILSKLDT